MKGSLDAKSGGLLCGSVMLVAAVFAGPAAAKHTFVYEFHPDAADVCRNRVVKTDQWVECHPNRDVPWCAEKTKAYFEQRPAPLCDKFAPAPLILKQIEVD